jgi:hypothetical protein
MPNRSVQQRKHVKKAKKEPDSSTSSDGEFFKQTTPQLENVKKVNERKTCKTMTLIIDVVNVTKVKLSSDWLLQLQIDGHSESFPGRSIRSFL